jgi:hypothetical protein
VKRLLALVLFPLASYAQVLTQTFVDPCSNQVLVVTVPLANGKTTIVYRGKFRVVTANDITSGALQAWINDLTINFPCPQATIAVTQTVTNAVQQAVSQATSSATAQATAQATSAATSAVVSVPSAPAPTTSTASSSAPEPSSSSSSSETKTETKTEAKSEEKSESKSESKSEKKSEEKKSSGKSVAKVNPIIYSSDFTVAPTTEIVSIIASVGMSQSSLMGNSSWGISSMIWSTFDQFALSGRYTKMNFNAGKLESITNYGITGVYLGGAVLGFGTLAYIYPLGKYGVTGANYTLSVAGADLGLNVSNNILVFYTLPVKISQRLTISPDFYISGSSTGYLTSQKLFVTSDDVGFLTGASFDIALTKRFKFNFGLKTSLNTNPLVPISFLGMIGTKINL